MEVVEMDLVYIGELPPRIPAFLSTISPCRKVELILTL